MRVLATCLLILLATSAHAERGEIYAHAVEILGGNERAVTKWRGEIRLAVIGGGDAASVAREAAREAAGLAGLTIVERHTPAESAAEYLELVRESEPFNLSASCTERAHEPCFNFVVVFGDDETLHALAEAIPLHPMFHALLETAPGAPCLFSPFRNRRFELWQAFVYVRADLGPQMARTCVYEEIYQSLGLFNDSTDSPYFSFNNVVAPKSITWYDQALLEALYDPRVTPGTPVNHVVEIFMKGVDARARAH